MARLAAIFLGFALVFVQVDLAPVKWPGNYAALQILAIIDMSLCLVCRAVSLAILATGDLPFFHDAAGDWTAAGSTAGALSTWWRRGERAAECLLMDVGPHGLSPDRRAPVDASDQAVELMSRWDEPGSDRINAGVWNPVREIPITSLSIGLHPPADA